MPGHSVATLMTLLPNLLTTTSRPPARERVIKSLDKFFSMFKVAGTVVAWPATCSQCLSTVLKEGKGHTVDLAHADSERDGDEGVISGDNLAETKPKFVRGVGQGD